MDLQSACVFAWGWETVHCWCLLSFEAKGQEVFEYSYHNKDIFNLSATKMQFQMEVKKYVLA